MSRNRTPNIPIGTVACPFADCTKTAGVYRYRAQCADPARQRRAGRLYLVCPDHGRSEPQEYILNNADITGPVDAADPGPATPPAPTPKHEPDPKPEPAPVTRTTWGFF